MITLATIMETPEDLSFEIEFVEDILRRDPNDPTVVELLANLYTKAGQIDQGLKLDRRLVKLQPANPVAHYNLACSLALKEKADNALQSLRTAIEHGYADWDWLLKDPDLTNLRTHPEFHAILVENWQGGAPPHQG